MFLVGTKVRVKGADGKLHEGKILDRIDTDLGDMFYWVSVGDDVWAMDEREISAIQEIDCDCGAKKLKHPGHSSWCSSQGIK